MIGLYFGSFNPVHYGHIQLAQYLIDNKLVDEIWFVVSPCNPLKDQHDLIDEYLRLEMLILATSTNSSLKVCDIEFTMPIPSYTTNTLQELCRQYPEKQFSLLIGSDNALVFDQWKNHEEILAQFPVWVYPRKGFESNQLQIRFPQMKILDSPYFEISSTLIRHSLQQKKDVTEWLHPFVYQFIKENDLYL